MSLLTHNQHLFGAEVAVCVRCEDKSCINNFQSGFNSPILIIRRSSIRTLQCSSAMITPYPAVWLDSGQLAVPVARYHFRQAILERYSAETGVTSPERSRGRSGTGDSPDILPIRTCNSINMGDYE